MHPREKYGAFLLYVDDWLSSTAIDLMTAAEERGYLRLLMHAWKMEDCGLPDDARVLAQLSKLGAAWKGKSGAVLRAQFEERGGRLFNDRLLRERIHQLEVRQGRKAASLAGHAARWGWKDAARMPNAMPKPCLSDCQNDANSKLETINESNRVEPRNSEMLITPERLTEAQEKMGAHRRRGDVPDETITRKILLYFEDMKGFDAWIADIGENLKPADITGHGYGLYLSDARQWTQSGGKRRQRKRKAPAWVPPSVQSSMDPETARRIREGRDKAQYFDPKTITGPQER